MDNLTKLLLEKGYITVDQLILLTLGRDSKKSKSIDELRKELNLPRSTLVDHLNKLENDGLVKNEKVGREKRIFPIPEISEKIIMVIDEFVKNYRNIIVHASKIKAKQMELLGKE